MSQPNHVWCGLVDEVRARRTQGRPQPWIVRKCSVGLTILIQGYGAYVYAGRFCRDMLVNSDSALGSRATGVVFLVVYALLLCLLSWCYVRAVTTPPGYARLYTQKTTKPGYDHGDTPTSSDIRGTSYELTSPAPILSHPLTHEPAKKHNPQASLGSGKSKPGASQLSIAASSVARMDQRSHSQPSARGLEEPRVTNGHGAPESPHVPDTATFSTAANSYQAGVLRPTAMFARRPTTTPVLLPEYRYCSRCQIVKPSRAHHCRACGTCVLKYDHHCPWIGQCVGAFNQKFFVNFLLWAVILAIWIFATLLGFNVRPHSSAAGLDPQQIVVIALAGFFGLFCTLLLLSQIRLVLLNQTTVESLNYRSMKDREQDMLSQMHKWYHIGAKRRTRQQWNEEWGRIGIEGNLWWLGSYRENWEAVMGKNVWWWILPVGHALGDGLNYPMNPRFDSAGRWKRRKEWPSDLQ